MVVRGHVDIVCSFAHSPFSKYLNMPQVLAPWVEVMQLSTLGRRGWLTGDGNPVGIIWGKVITGVWWCRRPM